jgi:hypothetical protein
MLTRTCRVVLSQMMKTLCLSLFAIAILIAPLSAAPPEFKWKEVEIDQIEIGYGLQLVDVDGDGKTDILLADKSTIQWYRPWR